MGDVLTAAAQKAGVAGLVIDGAVRDASSIVAVEFPVFARGVCIKGTTKDYPGSIGQPVTIGGQQICDGDYVVGDQDGLVVVRADEVEVSLALARAREAKEEGFLRSIQEGESTAELLGLMPRLRSRFPQDAALSDTTSPS